MLAVQTPPIEAQQEENGEREESHRIWKERCESLAGLPETPVSTRWWYFQEAFWVYLFVMGLHSGWHWSTTWKGHSSNSATLGALKTVGFGIFDLLACLALKASREAYRSKRLQDILEEAPLEVESLAKKCCFLGLLQAAVQALYWILFIYCMAQRDREDCHLAKLWLTSIGATGLVLCSPGLCCAFFPVLVGLLDAKTRLAKFADEIKEGLVPFNEVISKHVQLDQHVSVLAKELYYTVMLLLLACLIYTLLQCCSMWLWIDKVSQAPCSVYVTYALVLLYSGSFAAGYGLFSMVEQQHSDILSALASRIAVCPTDVQIGAIASLYLRDQPIKWKVPLSPKWPMAPTFERFQGALLVGSCAGKTGIQMIQGLFKVQQLSASKKDKTLQEAIKELSFDNVMQPKDQKESFEGWRPRWPWFTKNWPKLHLWRRRPAEPKGTIETPGYSRKPKSPAPFILAEAHQQSSKALAFLVCPSEWRVEVAALALLLMMLLQANSRRSR